MIKAVIFDYNGVLVDDLQLHEEAYFKASKELGLPITMERIKEFISLSPERKIKEYFGVVSPEMEKKILELKSKYYDELFEKTNIVFDGVAEMLDYLSKKYVLAVVSNTVRDYFNKHFPKELAARFTETMFADEIGKPKPAPDLLLKIIDKLGVKKEECVYIGDAVYDAQAAKAAGIKFILIASGNNTKEELLKEGDKVLDSIRELKNEL